MLKRTISYTDYDGNERTEDFWFNLTQAELVEMQMSETGGLQKTIENIVAAQDNKRIVQLFKDLVLKAYGEKSLDGRRFIKVRPDGTKPADEFSQTEAYSILFMELATDANSASAFVNGITPKIESKQKDNAPVVQAVNKGNN